MSGVGLTGAINPLNGGAFTVFAGNSVASLAALALFAGCATGTQVFVADQNEYYTLDSANAFTAHPTLVIAAAGGGRWFRKNKAYVIGNFTLWCQSYGFGLAGYTPGQLLATSTALPDILLDMRSGKPASSNQQQVTIDSLGNPWVVFNGFDSGYQVRKYRLSDCLATGVVTPQVQLTAPSVIATEAGYCLFDRTGSLWVANGTHGTFGSSAWARYGQKAYSLSGAPVPSSQLSIFNPGANAPSTSNQQSSLFDAAGNMWTSVAFTGAVGGANGGIIMVSAAQLAQQDLNVVPAVFWAGSNFTGTAQAATELIALAPSGLIWATNAPGNKLQAWDPRQGSGNPAPAIVLTSTSFNSPYGLAFDAAGNLWVSNGNANGLLRIPAASLAASGAVVPDVIITPANTVTLTSNIQFPNNPDVSGTLPSGAPA